jgi:ferredoxin
VNCHAIKGTIASAQIGPDLTHFASRKQLGAGIVANTPENLRTEVGSVLVQNDVCNGCGYCVVSCPFGVIDRRPSPLPDAGGAFKCTFCYDRQKSGLVPACAKVCPTESIVFGRLDDLRARATERVQYLRQSGYNDAQLYDPTETSVRGIHAFFLILGEPEAYGLPPKPQIPTIYLRVGFGQINREPFEFCGWHLGANGGNGFPHARLGAPIDDDPSAFGGQSFGNCETDSCSGTADKSEFVFELEIHV